jgi:hypothetical protein
MKKPVSLQTVLESVESLSTEDQDVLIERIQKRRIEQRQQAIAKNASDTTEIPTSEQPNKGSLDRQPMNDRANQRARAFQEWVERHRSLELPNLSEEALSRESIYGERG